MVNYNKFYTKKGYAQSVLDIPVRTSEIAKEVETLVKAAEAEGLSYTRKSLLSDWDTKAEDPDGPHTATLVASTDAVDQDHDSIVQTGISLKLFNKNPLLIDSHNYDLPPLGRALWTKVDGNLKSKVQFAARPADWPDTVWNPDLIFALVDQKILKGVSIGFLPTMASPPTEKEIVARPELAGAGRIIRKSVLFEISVVKFPCNPEAMIQAVSKGLISPDLYKYLGMDEPENDDGFWSWETKDFIEEVQAKEEKPAVSKLDLLKMMLANK